MKLGVVELLTHARTHTHTDIHTHIHTHAHVMASSSGMAFIYLVGLERA